MKIAICACGCSSRLTRKAARGNRGKRGRARFAPGHNAQHREFPEWGPRHKQHPPRRIDYTATISNRKTRQRGRSSNVIS